MDLDWSDTVADMDTGMEMVAEQLELDAEQRVQVVFEAIPYRFGYTAVRIVVDTGSFVTVENTVVDIAGDIVTHTDKVENYLGKGTVLLEQAQDLRMGWYRHADIVGYICMHYLYMIARNPAYMQCIQAFVIALFVDIVQMVIVNN